MSDGRSTAAPGCPLRIAVLLGGEGSTLQALLTAVQVGTSTAQPSVVVSHRARAGGLQRALAAHLPTLYLPPPPRHDTVEIERYERRLVALIRPFEVDVVLLAGWMMILSPSFLDAFPGRVLNIHPALLPDDGGDTVTLADGRRMAVFRGAHAVADALAAGVDTTGATVHLAVPEVDRGPVLRRAEVPIVAGESPEDLHDRIKIVEQRLLLEVLAAWPRLSPSRTSGARRASSGSTEPIRPAHTESLADECR